MGLGIKPIADRIVVKPADAMEVTSSGIYIPETAKEKPSRGTVVAVGNGKTNEPLVVQVGDTVLYGKFSGTEIEHDGEKYLLLREADVYAVV